MVAKKKYKKTKSKGGSKVGGGYLKKTKTTRGQIRGGKPTKTKVSGGGL